MKIAAATDDLKTVTGHVGRCNAFLVYEVENGNIVNREVRENTFTHHKAGGHNHEHHEHSHDHEHHHHHSHEALAEALSGCSHLICCGIGRRAINDLEQNGISVIITEEQYAEEAAVKLSKGELKTNPELTCRH
jgi:predicted Fe-Mo cluster-binding NifX family protein